jgi:hypothetical protein
MPREPLSGRRDFRRYVLEAVRQCTKNRWGFWTDGDSHFYRPSRIKRYLEIHRPSEWKAMCEGYGDRKVTEYIEDALLDLTVQKRAKVSVAWVSAGRDRDTMGVFRAELPPPKPKKMPESEQERRREVLEALGRLRGEEEDSDDVYFGHIRVANETSLSERVTRRVLRDLKKDGLVEGITFKHGVHDAWVYRLPMDADSP